jgi:NAD(P) transhydrogenase
VEVATNDGVHVIRADRIVVAVGTRSHHPPGVSLDGRTAVEPHQLLQLGIVPSTTVVVGGGLIGFEYASILSALGSYVILLEREDDVLPFIDRELAHALAQAVEAGGVELRLATRVTAVSAAGDGRLVTVLDNGDAITSRAVLWAADRHAATDDLRLDLTALVADHRGRLAVDEHHNTAVDHVYAVGEVVRFPCLVPDATAQGRIAARHACGVETRPAQRRAPLVLWSMPVLASAGLTEEELHDASRPYTIGRCSFSELLRGRLDADRGWLKILADADGRLLGAHAIGADAAELVHLGEAVIAAGGTLETLLASGYAYGCRADAYRLAALDAARQLAPA